MSDRKLKELKGRMWEAVKAARRERYCSHPDASPATCSDKIIRAHTVSKSSGLAKISNNGHVYVLKPDPWTKEGEEDFPCVQVGVDEATTFTGFCGYHDSTTFAPLETQPFKGTEEQCHLLGYRAVCREYYLKRVQLKVFTSYKALYERYLPLDHWMHQAAPIQLEGIRHGIQIYADHKAAYEQALLTRNYRDHRALVFFTRSTPVMMLSGAPTVEFDFDGNLIQRLARVEPLEITSLSLLGTEQGGAVVFHWEKASDTVSQQLIATLLRIGDRRKPDAIVRFAFEYIENIAVSPTWWEGLPDETQAALQRRMSAGTDMLEQRSSDGLRDDGMRFFAFQIERVRRHRF